MAQVYLSQSVSASVKCSNFIIKSFHIIWKQLKQKGKSSRHEYMPGPLWQRLVKWDQADGQSGGSTSSNCDRIGGNMDFNLYKSEMKQCNSKIFCFVFVVYWRHYG